MWQTLFRLFRRPRIAELRFGVPVLIEGDTMPVTNPVIRIPLSSSVKVPILARDQWNRPIAPAAGAITAVSSDSTIVPTVSADGTELTISGGVAATGQITLSAGGVTAQADASVEAPALASLALDAGSASVVVPQPAAPAS